MKAEDAPATGEEHINSMTTRIERLELRSAPASTSSTGGTTIYVQSNEPPDVPIGTLWFDTDESC